ncbi:MAG: tetratricopeptide repeat protein [Gemmatimonadales bacterium]
MDLPPVVLAEAVSPRSTARSPRRASRCSGNSAAAKPGGVPTREQPPLPAAGLALFHLAGLLPPLAAWLVAAFFLVHPVHVEAVAVAVNQSEIIVGLLAVVLVTFYLRIRERHTFRASHGAALFAIYLAATLFKESGLVLMGLIVAAELTVVKDDRPLKAQLGEIRPMLLVMFLGATTFFAIRTLALEAIQSAPSPRRRSTACRWAAARSRCSPSSRTGSGCSSGRPTSRVITPPGRSTPRRPGAWPRPGARSSGPGPGARDRLLAPLSGGDLRAPLDRDQALSGKQRAGPDRHRAGRADTVPAEHQDDAHDRRPRVLLARLGPAAAKYSTVSRTVALTFPAKQRRDSPHGHEPQRQRQTVWKDQFTYWNQTAIDAPLSYRATTPWPSCSSRSAPGSAPRKEYKVAIALYPRQWGAYFDLANKLRLNGLCEQAVRYYRETLLIEPEHESAQTSLIACLLYLGRYPDALAESREGMSYATRPARLAVFRKLLRVSDSAQTARAAPARSASSSPRRIPCE